MSPAAWEATDDDPRFPRVSGDEPGGGTAQTGDQEFSPRERG